MNTSNPFGNPTDSDENVFELDLQNETGSQTIPEGEYPGKLIGVEKTVAKSSGNPMWVWEFMITSGKEAGTSFKLFTAITPAALWKLVETLEALGIGSYGQNIKFTPEEVLGTPVVMHIEDDDYNGQERSTLARISKAEKAPMTVASTPTPTAPAKKTTNKKGPK